MDIAALERFLHEIFPQARAVGFRITELEEDRIVLRMSTTDAHLRPGGTVSGPTLVTLADSAAYLILLARIGPKALAVTTHLDTHFLRKPEPGELEATGSMLKLGKRIAVIEVRIHGGVPSELLAHATVTYSIPPER